MTPDEAIAKMIAPGTKRPGKYRQGVIQIHITRACDKSCFACTQGSNLAGKPRHISLEGFEAAVKSLVGYFGVVGMFGGNPAVHPKFEELCEILRKHIPYEQRGLWCNNPLGKGRTMAQTFNPAVSNLNVHLDAKAYAEFKRDWPQCGPVGLTKDSRHSPVHVAAKDFLGGPPIKEVEFTEGEMWRLISDCDINKHWSAMIAEFRGQPRAYFCEIAGAQAILHQDEPDYPDTGMALHQELHDKEYAWWTLPMTNFQHQVKKHCVECGVPLRGYGQLAQGGDDQIEQTSATHASIFSSKKKGREVELVTELHQIKPQALGRMTDYLGNSKR